MTKILKATCHGCWGVILFQLEGWRTAATEECRLRSGCQTQHSSATTEFSPIIKGGYPIQDSSPTNPVTPKSDCAKIPLQPHQKYCIIQCRENLAFHSLLRWKMIMYYVLWGACIRQINCDTREHGMNQSIHSMNSSGFHSTKPSPGANYSTTNSHNSIYAVDQGGNNQIWTIGNIINKNRTILYLIRPAEAVMEREQPRSTWNKDKIGGQHCWQKRISKQLCLTMHAQIFENPQNFAPMKHAQIACTDFQSFVIRKDCTANTMLPSQSVPFRHSSSLAMHGWRVNFKADNISQWQDFRWSILAQSILYTYMNI